MGGLGICLLHEGRVYTCKAVRTIVAEVGFVGSLYSAVSQIGRNPDFTKGSSRAQLHRRLNAIILAGPPWAAFGGQDLVRHIAVGAKGTYVTHSCVEVFLVETGRTVSGVEEAGFFADFADGTLLCPPLQTVLPRRTRPYPIRRQRPLLVNSLSHLDILPTNHSISA